MRYTPIDDSGASYDLPPETEFQTHFLECVGRKKFQNETMLDKVVNMERNMIKDWTPGKRPIPTRWWRISQWVENELSFALKLNLKEGRGVITADRVFAMIRNQDLFNKWLTWIERNIETQVSQPEEKSDDWSSYAKNP